MLRPRSGYIHAQPQAATPRAEPAPFRELLPWGRRAALAPGVAERCSLVETGPRHGTAVSAPPEAKAIRLPIMVSPVNGAGGSEPRFHGTVIPRDHQAGNDRKCRLCFRRRSTGCPEEGHRG